MDFQLTTESPMSEVGRVQGALAQLEAGQGSACRQRLPAGTRLGGGAGRGASRGLGLFPNRRADFARSFP